MTLLRQLNGNAIVTCIDCGDHERGIDIDFVGRFEHMSFFRFGCRTCRSRWSNHMPTRLALVSSKWLVHWWIAMQIDTCGNDQMTRFRAMSSSN